MDSNWLLPKTDVRATTSLQPEINALSQQHLLHFAGASP